MLNKTRRALIALLVLTVGASTEHASATDEALPALGAVNSMTGKPAPSCATTRAQGVMVADAWGQDWHDDTSDDDNSIPGLLLILAGTGHVVLLLRRKRCEVRGCLDVVPGITLVLVLVLVLVLWFLFPVFPVLLLVLPVAWFGIRRRLRAPRVVTDDVPARTYTPKTSDTTDHCGHGPSVERVPFRVLVPQPIVVPRPTVPRRPAKDSEPKVVFRERQEKHGNASRYAQVSIRKVANEPA